LSAKILSSAEKGSREHSPGPKRLPEGLIAAKHAVREDVFIDDLPISCREGISHCRKGLAMEKEKHIAILGILHIARGAIVLLLGMMGFGLFAGIGVLSGDPTALGILGILGTLAVVFMSVIALPSILAGVGLLRRHAWGRILALVVGFLSLIDIPFGTALGVYTIWVLMDDGIKKAFAGGAAVTPVAVNQAPTA
jgi:hypothetical protein